MKNKKIAVLTSKESWFMPYAKRFVNLLKKRKYNAYLFSRHEDINEEFEVVFILSYFRIIKSKYLKRHKYNLVVHESSLPKGKGWSPLFWQILEGKNKIPIVLFQAGKKMDDGDIYIKDYIRLKGYELNAEVRKSQATKTIGLCLKFLKMQDKLKPRKQYGRMSFYRKRIPADSELDINKTIEEQFNLLRIVDNKYFPAFFYRKGNKYILRVYKEKLKG
ncbi:MAG: formyltransferase family protein [Candidatus Omnitrophica bacterium]|nr:formyltransferase family protein [Candidatus Omnitrophota bacterium]